MDSNKGVSKFIHPMIYAKMTRGTKETLTVIVHSNGTCDHIREQITNAGGKIKYELPFIGAIAAEIPTKSIAQVAQHHKVEYVHDDAKVFKCMDIATLAVGSELVNEAGYSGEGIGVAVLDTGVFPHDDLVKPTNRIVAFKDFINDRSRPYDDDGHGTHVAGIIAGNGYANSKYKGIAPEANIIGVKVLDETGSGDTSDILAGLQWVIDNQDKYNIKVISMSLGSAADSSSRQDALARGVNSAVQQGITVVVSAGNSGPTKQSITSPGIAQSAITVGAVDDNRTPSVSDDFIADFSSRGPTIDGLSKPDVVAPGVDIHSLSNKGSSSYVSHSGTSMAAPIVSGAAALLYEKEPNLTPSQVKSRIVGSAIPIDRNRYAQGAGILNVKSTLNIEDLPVPENESNTPSRRRPMPYRRNRRYYDPSY